MTLVLQTQERLRGQTRKAWRTIGRMYALAGLLIRASCRFEFAIPALVALRYGADRLGDVVAGRVMRGTSPGEPEGIPTHEIIVRPTPEPPVRLRRCW